jgi:hypothetical protein
MLATVARNSSSVGGTANTTLYSYVASSRGLGAAALVLQRLPPLGPRCLGSTTSACGTSSRRWTHALATARCCEASETGSGRPRRTRLWGLGISWGGVKRGERWLGILCAPPPAASWAPRWNSMRGGVGAGFFRISCPWAAALLLWQPLLRPLQRDRRRVLGLRRFSGGGLCCARCSARVWGWHFGREGRAGAGMREAWTNQSHPKKI